MKKLIINISVLLLLLVLYACKYNNDNDLERPDGYKGSYLTPLGCLVDGPWAVSEAGDGYNVKLFLDGKEISSKGYLYTELQKDLVFKLHKDGTLTYWLRSENGDAFSKKNGDSVTLQVRNSSYDYEQDLKKKYTDGYWKANFKDSTLSVHFNNKNIPDLNYKYESLGVGDANFQESYFVDSVYNGKKVTMKRVNTIYYEVQYPKH